MVGGNDKAKAFFKNQADYREGMTIRDKYHTRAAALYKDKVSRLNEYIIPGKFSVYSSLPFFLKENTKLV